MTFREQDKDTICAPITPPGFGGVCVLRLSGASSERLIKQICPFLPDNLTSHRVYYGILTGLNKEDIDEVLVTFFEKGRSFTGDMTFEISCHGSPVLTSKIANALIQLGARLAEPGEFTYRAFINGRIDLIQAESVLSLIESRSEQSAKLSLRQLKGELSKELLSIEDRLIWVLAQVEANIDYATEDIIVESDQTLAFELRKILDQLINLLNGYRYGKSLREGVFVTLVGEPNVGKSSLLNSILAEERAIVTEVPGTTRDVIEGEVIYKGVPLIIQDTAGLRETDDIVEKLGIGKTQQAVEKSDCVLHILDVQRGVEDLKNRLSLFKKDHPHFIVFNKCDLLTEQDFLIYRNNVLESLALFLTPSDLKRVLWVSALESHSSKEILNEIVGFLKPVHAEGSLIVIQQRHYELLSKMRSSVEQGLEVIQNQLSSEFLAFELQAAILGIHEILGKEFDDQVMDRVFKDFCLGK